MCKILKYLYGISYMVIYSCLFWLNRSMKFPVLVLALLYLIFNFSVLSIKLLFIIVVFEIILYYAILLVHDYKTYLEFYLYCKKYSHYKFVKVEPQSLIKSEELDLSIKGLLTSPVNVAEICHAI